MSLLAAAGKPLGKASAEIGSKVTAVKGDVANQK